MIRNTYKPCPSCYYPNASHWYDTEDKSPNEVHCDDCGFDWQASRSSGLPYGDAEEHRLARQALEEEATAHRGLREEAAAYQDPEDREEE